MSKKHKADNNGFVYSTDPSFNFNFEPGNAETFTPSAQKLRIKLETKHRAGKTVTIVDGFIGSSQDMDELCKKLKNFCGTGGSAKDSIIVIQGEQREKVLQWLLKNNYTQSKIIK